MVKSMTGYGRGERSGENRTVTVELRAVNNRYLDCAIKLPRAYLFAQDVVKERVGARVARGKVDVFVSIDQTGGEALTVTVNEPLARAYLDALWQLYQIDGGQRMSMSYKPTDLASFPDVRVVERQPEDQQAVQELILEALETALDDLEAMRCREGARMAQDILARAQRVEELTGQIEARSPQSVADYRERLTARLREILGSAQLDEGRLLTEAAIFADKVAVDEETVRLRSHLAQLRELLGQGGPVGRKLDFLIQEFNREANTIGSKCADLENTRSVVELKAEIEKIREQVQNLE